MADGFAVFMMCLFFVVGFAGIGVIVANS